MERQHGDRQTGDVDGRAGGLGAPGDFQGVETAASVSPLRQAGVPVAGGVRRFAVDLGKAAAKQPALARETG